MNPIFESNTYGYSPYPRTTVDSTSFLVLEKADHHGIKMGPNWSAISDLLIPQIDKKFYCLCSFPLSDWGIQGHSLPVLYYEERGSRWVFSKLDADNKIIEIWGANRDLSRIQSIDESFRSSFDEDTLEILEDVSAGCFKVKKKEHNLPEEMQHTDALETFYEEARDNNEVYFGAVPYPIQSNFAVPIFEGEELPFVGQFEFGFWELEDLVAYLFYSPEKRILAQLIQFT